MNDISNKSQSRNVLEQLKKVVDEKGLSYNPPFGYCIKVLDANQVLLGLGNGTILKFKKKKLQLDEVYSDLHSN